MTRFTASDIAKANNVPRIAAASFILYLRGAGLVTPIGLAAKPEGQKGRGESLYEGDAAQINAHLNAFKLSA